MTEPEYVYACFKHVELRNNDAAEQAKVYNTAYEQLDRPLLHIVKRWSCALIVPGSSGSACDGPIFRWKTSVLAAPGAAE